MIVLLAIIGLIIGSFLGSLTWRLPRGKSVASGRSVCPRCKHKIAWYYNIPLISYLFFLRGKCAYCHKAISVRYPLIEGSTAAIFVLVGLTFDAPAKLIFYLLISTIAIAVFVVDFEHQIIPDEFVFFGLAFVTLFFLITGFESFFSYLFSGLIASSFLLLLNIATKGRGMGLGDVKLALFMGSVLGPRKTVVWLFAAFVIGAVVGIILMLFGQTSFRKRIAFGPFLVIGFFVAILVGSMLEPWLIPI